ncbi:MAG: hypothetical protein WCH75_12905, partial [Candidatus Binatia bacterium]
MSRECSEVHEGSSRGLQWLRALAIIVTAVLLSDLVPKIAQAAESKPVSVEELSATAQQEGVRIIVIEPDQRGEPAAPSPTPPSMMAGGAMADVAGQVTKRLERLIQSIASPDWPQPSSNPTKPLTNGILTVLGLVIGLAITKRAGLSFQPRFGRQAASGVASPSSRPMRIGRALLGVAITAIIALVMPLAIYGGGSKTVELVGLIIDVYFRMALVMIVTAALLERAHDRETGYEGTVHFEQIERDVRIVLTMLFLFYSVALIFTFMFPDDTMNKLARLTYVSFTALLAASLIVRHRADFGVFVKGVVGERFQWLSRSAWAVVCAYVLVTWLIACVLVLLDRDYALRFVMAPAFGLLVGVSVYHIIVFLAGLVWKTKQPPPGSEGIEMGTAAREAPAGHQMRWARNMACATGITVGVLVILQRFGLSLINDDGSMGFVLTAAIVILFAYGIWTYTRQAIDHRIAIEQIPAPGEDGANDEGGVGQSRLATLLPLLRNAIMLTIVFLVSLILLAKAGV